RRGVERGAEALDPARGELRLALGRFRGRRIDVVEDLAAAALLDLVLGRRRFDLGDGVFVVAEHHGAGRAVRIGNHPGRLGLADLDGIFLDVDEEIDVRLRPGIAGGVQADELDALRDAGLTRVL